MLIYILMLITSLACAYSSRKQTGKKKKILQIMSAVPFILVSGLRYNVGYDYLFRYVPDYLLIHDGLNVPNMEYIVKVLIKICSLITRDYWIFFLITSIIINAIVFKIIYKYSKYPLMSISIYFFNTSFFMSMNLVRQYIGTTIILIAILMYLNDKNKIKFVLMSVLACLFHTSTIVMLPIIFINKKRFSIILLAIMSVFVLVFGKDVLDMALSLFSNFSNINLLKYSVYTSYGGNLPFSSLIVETMIYAYYYYIYKNSDETDEEEYRMSKFFLNTQWITILFIVLCSVNELFIRLSSMVILFQLISLPHFYDIDKKQNKKLIHKDQSVIMLFLIMIMIILRMLYSICIKGAIAVIPYKSISDRPQDIYSEMNYNEYFSNEEVKNE